jgi:hypothetical protein
MTQRDRDRLVVLKQAQKKLIGQGQAENLVSRRGKYSTTSRRV